MEQRVEPGRGATWTSVTCAPTAAGAGADAVSLRQVAADRFGGRQIGHCSRRAGIICYHCAASSLSCACLRPATWRAAPIIRPAAKWRPHLRTPILNIAGQPSRPADRPGRPRNSEKWRVKPCRCPLRAARARSRGLAQGGNSAPFARRTRDAGANGWRLGQAGRQNELAQTSCLFLLLCSRRRRRDCLCLCSCAFASTSAAAPSGPLVFGSFLETGNEPLATPPAHGPRPIAARARQCGPMLCT